MFPDGALLLLPGWPSDLVLLVRDVDRYHSVIGTLVLDDPLHALLHELHLRGTLRLTTHRAGSAI